MFSIMATLESEWRHRYEIKIFELFPQPFQNSTIRIDVHHYFQQQNCVIRLIGFGVSILALNVLDFGNS